MVRNPAMARSRCEDQLIQTQVQLLGVANLASREGDEQTARAALALCDLVREVTTEHSRRAG